MQYIQKHDHQGIFLFLQMYLECNLGWSFIMEAMDTYPTHPLHTLADILRNWTLNLEKWYILNDTLNSSSLILASVCFLLFALESMGKNKFLLLHKVCNSLYGWGSDAEVCLGDKFQSQNKLIVNSE